MTMATIDRSRTAYVRALPTLASAARLIDISPAGVTRGVEELGLEPVPWGRREKHLYARDLLRLAAYLRRASVEEVAGGLLEGIERDHPKLLGAISAEVDQFFASLPKRQPSAPDEFLAELHEALPERYAKQAEEIYLGHADSSR
jgi:hypothetical protein